MAFAKLKVLLRAKALHIEELWKVLGNLVGCFGATEVEQLPLPFISGHGGSCSST
jgi:hypothetical protein